MVVDAEGVLQLARWEMASAMAQSQHAIVGMESQHGEHSAHDPQTKEQQARQLQGRRPCRSAVEVVV